MVSKKKKLRYASSLHRGFIIPLVTFLFSSSDCLENEEGTEEAETGQYKHNERMLRQPGYFEAKWAFSRRWRSGSFTFPAGWCRLTYSGIFDLQKPVVLASHDHSPRNRLSHFNAKFWRGAANEAAGIPFSLVGGGPILPNSLKSIFLLLFFLLSMLLSPEQLFQFDWSLMAIS